MAKNEKSFETSQQVVALRPKVAVENVGFIYNGTQDIKNLIKFVGTRPTLDENGDIFFKNHKITEGSVVMRDAQGKVTAVYSKEEAEAKFEIVASHSFTDEDANKITPKVVTERKRTKEGMTRKELREALKAAGVKFPDSQPKEVYQKLWDEHNAGKTEEVK